MAKRSEKAAPHPDDFMVVSVVLEFQAKLNPSADHPPSFETLSVELCLGASDAGPYVEKVLNAIRERRLYGFMVQEMAESAVGAGQWIQKTTNEIIAEMMANRRSENSDPNLPPSTRHDEQ